MRAGPLSDPRVIALLNGRFIPVFVTNEDYDEDGPAPPDERAARNRIWREALDKDLSSGTVHAYVLAPDDARVVASMHVAEAAVTEKLLPMLVRAADELQAPTGEPIVPPKAQSDPPESGRDALVLHLVARGFNEGSWREFPGENWIVLDLDQQAAFTPAGEAGVGRSWAIDRLAAEKILTHFYPQTENNSITRNHEIDRLELTGRVISVEAGIARARLEGTVRIAHAFYPGRPDGQYAEAAVVGYVDFDPAGRRIRALKLVTDEASYGGDTRREGFGVAARSVE
jgi:hypothetical protein